LKKVGFPYHRPVIDPAKFSYRQSRLAFIIAIIIVERKSIPAIGVTID
jgi:hypothetical protein